MATWKADELTDDVQGNAAVRAPFPARNFAEDVPRKGAAELVNTIYVPLGGAIRIERGVNSERGGPCQTEIASVGVHDGRAPAIDGRHDRRGIGSRGKRKEHGCQNRYDKQTKGPHASLPCRSTPVLWIATRITRPPITSLWRSAASDSAPLLTRGSRWDRLVALGEAAGEIPESEPLGRAARISNAGAPD